MAQRTRRDPRLHQHRNPHCHAMQNGEGMEGRAPKHPVRLGLKWGAGGSNALEEGAGLWRKWSLRKGTGGGA
eukprot:667260-Rhodomonas_salina.1